MGRWRRSRRCGPRPGVAVPAAPVGRKAFLRRSFDANGPAPVPGSGRAVRCAHAQGQGHHEAGPGSDKQQQAIGRKWKCGWSGHSLRKEKAWANGQWQIGSGRGMLAKKMGRAKPMNEQTNFMRPMPRPSSANASGWNGPAIISGVAVMNEIAGGAFWPGNDRRLCTGKMARTARWTVRSPPRPGHHSWRGC